MRAHVQPPFVGKFWNMPARLNVHLQQNLLEHAYLLECRVYAAMYATCKLLSGPHPADIQTICVLTKVIAEPSRQ